MTDPQTLNSNNAKTVADALSFVEQTFTESEVYLGHGTDSYWDEAVHLVLFAINQPLDADESLLTKVLSTQDHKKINDLLEKRIQQRLPLPYITGQAWFAGLCFSVNSSVLIPRSPIAELIERQFSPWCAEQPKSILDLCCGGGCIGIASAEYLPESKVDLADLSPQALAVAEQNRLNLSQPQRVTCYESDLFAALPKSQQYDVIVSNPPYVDAEDMASLPPEYLHEPRMALAAGDDGLDLVRRILQEAADYLSDAGVLIVEVGNSWEALERAYPNVSFVWLEFERGGHGVFLLTKSQLRRCY